MADETRKYLDISGVQTLWNKVKTLLSAKANTADLATVATSGDYDDLINKPTIPSGQVNADWNATSGVSEILNKPTIPSKTSDLNNDSDFVSDASYVHTDVNFTSTLKSKLDGIASGAEVNVQSDWNDTNSYSDAFIKNKPTIPTVNNGTLTIQKNGSTVSTFTANSSSNVTANITVPKVVGGTVIITFNGSGYRDVALSAFSGLTSKPDSLILSAQSSHNCFIEYDWDASNNNTLRIHGHGVNNNNILINLNGNVRIGWIAINK